MRRRRDFRRLEPDGAGGPPRVLLGPRVPGGLRPAALVRPLGWPPPAAADVVRAVGTTGVPDVWLTLVRSASGPSESDARTASARCPAAYPLVLNGGYRVTPTASPGPLGIRPFFAAYVSNRTGPARPSAGSPQGWTTTVVNAQRGRWTLTVFAECSRNT